MPLKLKLGKRFDEFSAVRSGHHGLANRLLLYFIIAIIGCALVFGIVVTFFYLKYANMVDQRLARGPLFATTAQVYAAPRQVRVRKSQIAPGRADAIP